MILVHGPTAGDSKEEKHVACLENSWPQKSPFGDLQKAVSAGDFCWGKERNGGMSLRLRDPVFVHVCK